MRKILIPVILILLVLLGITSYLSHMSVSPSTSAPVSTDCSGCIGLAQNHTNITETKTSRITLELPQTYDRYGLTIMPVGSMGETFGATAPAGYWVRTFEAVVPGTTTITVPQTVSSQAPYVLTVVIK